MIAVVLRAVPGRRLLSVIRDLLVEAANLRAGMVGIRTPNAVHGAAARPKGCSMFAANDRALRSVTNISMAVLDYVH